MSSAHVLTGRKRVLVTGASSGIGAAIAARLARAAWDVVGVSRRGGFADPSDAVIEREIYWYQADLADPVEIDTLIAQLRADGRDRFDALVHAAGLQITAPLGDLSAEAGRRMWAVHVEAPTLLTNALVAGMPDGGRILLIGSRTAAGAAGKSQYATTKAAMIGLSRSWAMDVIDRRICVNVLAPGPTATAMTTDTNRRSTPAKVPPFGRMIEPDEVAQFADFLLGPGGAMITGQHLVMCGGTSVAASR